MIVKPSPKMGDMSITNPTVYQRPLDRKHADDDELEEIGEKHFVIPEGSCYCQVDMGGLY